MDRVSIKERGVLRLYTCWRRFRTLPVIEFPDALNHIERLLICLPADPEEARQAADVIPELIRCLQAESAIVLGEQSATTSCTLSEEGLQVITIGDTDRRWTGSPSSDLIDRVVGSGLNVAVDLSLQMDLLTSALCLQSKAPARFCFCGPYRALFFNIQIVLSDQTDPLNSEIDPINQADLLIPSLSNSPYGRLLHIVQRMTGHAPSPQEST